MSRSQQARRTAASIPFSSPPAPAGSARRVAEDQIDPTPLSSDFTADELRRMVEFERDVIRAEEQLAQARLVMSKAREQLGEARRQRSDFVRGLCEHYPLFDRGPDETKS